MANEYYISAGLPPMDGSTGATANSFYIGAGLIPDDTTTSSAATGNFDGALVIKSAAADSLDGKAAIKDTATNLADGRLLLGAVGSSFLDGKTAVKDAATGLLDGKAVVKDIATGLLDGAVLISSAVPSETVFDGAALIRSAATGLMDGALVLFSSDVINALDGSVHIEDATAALLDGEIDIASPGRNYLDGALVLSSFSALVFDGKVRPAESATGLMDGTVFIAETPVLLFDGALELPLRISPSVWAWKDVAPAARWTLPAAAPQQDIFICVLRKTGYSDVEVPMSSLQMRRRDGNPTMVQVVVPDAMTYLEYAQDREGGEIIVYAGKLSSGTRHLSELDRATLETIRYDHGVRSSSLTLEGYRTDSNTNPRPIYLGGVSYRALQSDGRRRVRGNVNIFLRPGDTAVYTEDAFVVEQIYIKVEAENSWMEATGI